VRSGTGSGDATGPLTNVRAQTRIYTPPRPAPPRPRAWTENLCAPGLWLPRTRNSLCGSSAKPTLKISPLPTAKVRSSPPSLPIDLWLTPVAPVYAHPLVLLAWASLSLLLIHYMEWWPSRYSSISSILGYLLTLPAFASVAVPIMFLIDWWDLMHGYKRPRSPISLFIGKIAPISNVAPKK
jgi:hypothetical protein